VRFRGWHLDERHVTVDGIAAPASLVDFALTFFHGAQEALNQGAGPYYYLPKLEGHLEARLWNDVFNHAQDALNIPRGSIRATVLVETILAAFEMDEIIYELREHSAGLNAGRWDYIFSVAKKFAAHKSFVLPYTELLVATCHKRGVHAMGGMAAFIPNRHDPEVTEHAIAKVTQGKALEAADGCDGTWVAHPDLVSIAQAEFDAVLQGAVHQLGRQRPEVSITASDLLSVDQTVGSITEEGLRINIHVGLRYLAGWLNGLGAAAIHNMMEDAATAEICRSQIWQWIQHGCSLDDGRLVTPDLVRELADQEMASIEETLGAEMFANLPFGQAKQVFEDLALTDDFIEFLTLPLYELLD
jgi:malate synthase